MQGSIQVESEVGTGSTFRIELPLVSSQLEDAQKKDVVTKISPPVPAISETKKTVLYIEDNPANLKLVSQIIERYEAINLLTAHSGELGLDLARTHQPELILLDINIPGMDGYQILEVCRQDDRLKGIPVVAITANAMPDDIQRGNAAGFDHYLTKPLDIALFHDIMVKTLETDAR
jgi:CheY-like chemotaxis protein